jgi:phosphotransferase system  glucose/maltose/N-acetylglucosamine-specific IIC component
VRAHRKAIAALAVLLLGVAFCFVMYWWQLRYTYAFHGAAGNLVLAIPFAGLAVMVAFGMSRLAAVASWLVLAALIGLAYVSAATSSSSTAAIVFIVPFVYGGVIVSVIFAVDSTIRRRMQRRRSSAEAA